MFYILFRNFGYFYAKNSRHDIIISMMLKRKIAKWLDEWKLAWMGVVLATKRWKFVVIVLLVFLLFGTLMNLIAVSGLGVFKLINFKIIWKAMIGLFGIEKEFSDWLPVFLVAIMQGILIGLVVFVWKKRRDINKENVQTAGIAAGLAILGAGCPTCGTTLLTPIISAIFSGGSYAIAGTISSVITWVAIAIVLLAIKRVGLETYVIITSERFRKKRGNDEKDN